MFCFETIAISNEREKKVFFCQKNKYIPLSYSIFSFGVRVELTHAICQLEIESILEYFYFFEIQKNIRVHCFNQNCSILERFRYSIVYPLHIVQFEQIPAAAQLYEMLYFKVRNNGIV